MSSTEDTSIPSQKSGYVAIVGRPNVGKSSLLNQLLGQKISITSSKPQTTRHRILGIDTRDATQIVYVDTPGMHLDAKKALNRQLNKTASSAFADVDLILFVIEGNRWYDDDQWVLEQLQSVRVPVFLILNKIDLLVRKEELLPLLAARSQLRDFAEIIPVSAHKGDNLNALAELVRARMPASIHYFPEDYVTDRSQRFLVAEMIREKLMRFMGDEVPYALAVQIEEFKYEGSMARIIALILVERPAQRAIVIGENGNQLKRVGQEARQDMENMLGCKVFLQLWVKVKSGWADDERALRSLGYDE